MIQINKCVSQRQSNIEALRLLSMLMVLNLHSFHGYDNGDGIEQYFDFFRETTSICAVNVFLIISGYWGIRWKFKSFYNLIFQVVFYAFGVYIVASLIGIVDFSIEGFLSNLKCLYDYWGFVTGYILLYVCSPFLNTFVETNDSRKVLKVILLLLVSEIFITRGSGVLIFWLPYLIGRYIKKSDLVENLQIKACKFYWIVTIIIFISVMALFKSGFCTTAERMCSIPIGYSYSSPFVLLQGVFLFICFARFSFQSRFVNWCSASCFAIFLMHMHPLIKHIGYYSITAKLYERSFGEHLILLVILIITVFFVSILIDKFRGVMSNFLYKQLCIIKNLLPKRLFEEDTYLKMFITK